MPPSRAMSTQKRPSAVISLFLCATPRDHSTADTSSCSLLLRATGCTLARHTRSARRASPSGNFSANVLLGSRRPAQPPYIQSHDSHACTGEQITTLEQRLGVNTGLLEQKFRLLRPSTIKVCRIYPCSTHSNRGILLDREKGDCHEHQVVSLH